MPLKVTENHLVNEEVKINLKKKVKYEYLDLS